MVVLRGYRELISTRHCEREVGDRSVLSLLHKAAQDAGPDSHCCDVVWEVEARIRRLAGIRRARRRQAYQRAAERAEWDAYFSQFP